MGATFRPRPCLVRSARLRRADRRQEPRHFLGEGLLRGTNVPGWTTLVVLLSFFNGVTMLMLGMLGEYMIRVINQLNMADPYFVRETIRHDA